VSSNNIWGAIIITVLLAIICTAVLLLIQEAVVSWKAILLDIAMVLFVLWMLNAWTGFPFTILFFWWFG